MIERKKYLDALIKRKWNGRIKVVTGIRRCGKSILLFELFRQHLLSEGVPEQNIISLDVNEKYRKNTLNIHQSFIVRMSVCEMCA